MNPSPLISLSDFLPLVLAAAILAMETVKEISLAVAAAITLWGIWLSWLAPHRQMSIEERAKNGRLTEEQARRKIRQHAWFGPVVTVMGIVLLCGVLMN